MRYLYIKWIHKNPADPVHIYSEIGNDSYELRRMEVWSNGRKGFADGNEQQGGTELSVMPIPTLAEIAAQPEYQPKAIVAEDFHKLWLKRR